MQKEILSDYWQIDELLLGQIEQCSMNILLTLIIFILIILQKEILSDYWQIDELLLGQIFEQPDYHLGHLHLNHLHLDHPGHFDAKINTIRLLADM